MLLAKISADFLKILFLRPAVTVVVLRNDFFLFDYKLLRRSYLFRVPWQYSVHDRRNGLLIREPIVR